MRARRLFSSNCSCTASNQAGSTSAGTGMVIHSSDGGHHFQHTHAVIAEALPRGARKRGRTGPVRFAKGRLADVSRIFQHIPNGLVIPMFFACLGVYPCLMEATTHLIDRTAFLPHPCKHLLYDASLVKDDLKTSLSTSFLFVHITISIGRMTENANASL